MIKLTTYIVYYNCALLHSLKKYIPYIFRDLWLPFISLNTTNHKAPRVAGY